MSVRLQRKCSCGGTPGPSGECAECRKKRLLQTKLTVNEPGDKYEQEADRVAEQVMRGPAPERASLTPLRLQRLEESTAHAGAEAPPIVGDVLASPGRPLDAGTRSFMESRFGHDFSQVRVHTDTRAAESARAVQARAYTVGQDVAFGAGQFAPGTTDGKQLLTHELTHVVQQDRFSNSSATDKPVLQRQKKETRQQEEQNLLYSDAPAFPGCSPRQRFVLDLQLQHVRAMVEIARKALADELARKDRSSGTVSIAGSVFRRYFRSDSPQHMRTALVRLARIENRLARGPRNWRCLSEAGCRNVCGDACSSPQLPVSICGKHVIVASKDYLGYLLVHEAAHQAGLGLGIVLKPGEVYADTERFARLTTGEALDNPDSYTRLTQEIIHGPAPPTPGLRAWTSRDMGILAELYEPLLKGVFFGFLGYGLVRVPPGSVAVNRFEGVVVFDMTTGHPRPVWPGSPTSKVVSMHIELVRSGPGNARQGRPWSSVLMDQTVRTRSRIPPNQQSRLAKHFSWDYHFDTADWGFLIFEASLHDPDTKTTLTYRDMLLVRPTAPLGTSTATAAVTTPGPASPGTPQPQPLAEEAEP